jgi:hypothetical protein
MFIPGMAWTGTHQSFYKIWVGDLSRSVGKGRYPRTPTRAYRYTPVLPEEPEGGQGMLERDEAIGESEACFWVLGGI